MDLGEVGVRVKRALELDRKIKFISGVVGLSDAQRLSLIEPLLAARTAILQGDSLGAVQAPQGPPAAPLRK
ncbi:MAG: hypothetical protein [Microvirus sp.]|nr:MAG: hypothetical protein [Microvirus sp.]